MADRSEFRPNLRIFGVRGIDPGWIYVVKNGDLLKVGKTKNPKRRIFCDAKTWIPDLEVIGIKPFWDISALEKVIHAGIAQYWYDKEWFKFPDKQMYEWFTSGFREFYDNNRNMNSVDFIYWINSSGMGEVTYEKRRQKLTMPKWFEQESISKKS